MPRVSGSHYMMRHPDGRGTIVPVHGNRDVAKGTLRWIRQCAGLLGEDKGLGIASVCTPVS
jgi:predicted RNA binding protein YcfA (HicA-like mRNA interferase family)